MLISQHLRSDTKYFSSIFPVFTDVEEGTVNNTARGTVSNARPTANKDRDMHQYIWEVIYIFFIPFSSFHRCKRGHKSVQPTEWGYATKSIVVTAFRYPTGRNAWE